MNGGRRGGGGGGRREFVIMWGAHTIILIEMSKSQEGARLSKGGPGNASPHPL